jgi:hypothetical protein
MLNDENIAEPLPRLGLDVFIDPRLRTLCERAEERPCLRCVRIRHAEQTSVLGFSFLRPPRRRIRFDRTNVESIW